MDAHFIYGINKILTTGSTWLGIPLFLQPDFCSLYPSHTGLLLVLCFLLGQILCTCYCLCLECSSTSFDSSYSSLRFPLHLLHDLPHLQSGWSSLYVLLQIQFPWFWNTVFYNSTHIISIIWLFSHYNINSVALGGIFISFSIISSV